MPDQNEQQHTEQPLPVPPMEFGPEDRPSPAAAETTRAEEQLSPEEMREGLQEVHRVSRVVFFFLFSALAAILLILLATLFT